ncbi:hypothetical protein [Prosthecochloris sp.]|uniref:hypothetical protein n=2 Tax=unclassified Prosthecochloris TaxID=2632826 RepID=UPI00257E796B|nr:hypothetical protein [Prosthecochloris sp.]
MPHVMRHPCGATKPVMDPRVALHLPEDDKERSHAARDAASMRINEVGNGARVMLCLPEDDKRKEAK